MAKKKEEKLAFEPAGFPPKVRVFARELHRLLRTKRPAWVSLDICHLQRVADDRPAPVSHALDKDDEEGADPLAGLLEQALEAAMPAPDCLPAYAVRNSFGKYRCLDGIWRLPFAVVGPQAIHLCETRKAANILAFQGLGDVVVEFESVMTGVSL